eukprot:15693938-Heterocapsa_arctica.AAC.1
MHTYLSGDPDRNACFGTGPHIKQISSACMFLCGIPDQTMKVDKSPKPARQDFGRANRGC